MAGRDVFISWDRTRISYRISGNERSTKTIVFVNGLFCTESYFVYLLNDLADEYRLVTYDHRGHQYSGLPADPDNVTIPDAVADIEALFNHLEIEKAALVGFSLGVQMIFEFYKQQPERVAGLAAICGPYENPLSTFYGLTIPDVVWETVLGFAADKIPDVTNKIWHSLFNLPFIHKAALLSGGTRASAELMEPFYAHQRVVDAANGLRMAAAALKHSARDILPTIDVPTLVVGAEKDTFTPIKLSRIMRDEIPGVDYVFAPGGSHATLVEQPELINEAIRPFLSKRVFPGSAKKAAG